MVKRAHLVTGKGGVGKSLFSAVLAHYFSTQNLRILLTELSEHSFFKDYLGLESITYSPEIYKSPLNSSGRLEICQWSPEDCLKEYSLHLLKIESLYRLFFQNPVSKSLIQVAPGLQELALLGKLTSSPRKHGPAMEQDQIVVDSFASGHFMSLLRAPEAMLEAVPFGPMGEQSRSINSWIRNSEFTQIHLVTLAEELPMTEALELHFQLKTEFGLNAKIYLNKISGLTPNDLKELSTEASDSLGRVIESESKARQQLTNAGLAYTELPLIADLNVYTIISSLVQTLQKAGLTC